MKHPVTRELYSYWNRLRAGRSAPERTQIDPAAIRGILSDTFILDVEREDDQQRFPIRLSGTRLNAFFLTELKGQCLLDLWSGDDRAAMRRILACVLDGCTPVIAGLRAAPEGHRPVDLELLLLPLKHHGRTHERMLGAIAPATVPSWLGLLPIDHLSIVSLRLVDRTADWTMPAREDAAGRPGFSRVSPGRQYGYLVVHDGGR